MGTFNLIIVRTDYPSDSTPIFLGFNMVILTLKKDQLDLMLKTEPKLLKESYILISDYLTWWGSFRLRIFLSDVDFVKGLSNTFTDIYGKKLSHPKFIFALLLLSTFCIF